MMKKILIAQIKKAAEILGKNPSQIQIKRLEQMGYAKLMEEAEYARQAVAMQLHIEGVEGHRKMVLEYEKENKGTSNEDKEELLN